jgi:hypothetical protein
VVTVTFTDLLYEVQATGWPYAVSYDSATDKTKVMLDTPGNKFTLDGSLEQVAELTMIVLNSEHPSADRSA